MGLILFLEVQFMKEKTAEYINVLGRFCGKRDILSLSKEELKRSMT